MSLKAELEPIHSEAIRQLGQSSLASLRERHHNTFGKKGRLTEALKIKPGFSGKRQPVGRSGPLREIERA